MKPSGAIAVGFTWTSPGAVGTVTIGGVDYSVTVPSIANTRVLLAPSGEEWLAHVAAAINTAVAASGRSFTLTLDDDGRAVLEVDVGVFNLALLASINVRLGFLPSATGAGSITADTPPPHLVLFLSLSGGTWQPRQAGGARRTTGGRVYAIAATGTSWDRSLRATLIPADPTARAEAGTWCTPVRPADEYMGSLGDLAIGREWSMLDAWQLARNANCALAVANFQQLRTSTSERYWVGQLGPKTLLSPMLARLREDWTRYESTELEFVLPTQGASGTRA